MESAQPSLYTTRGAVDGDGAGESAAFVAIGRRNPPDALPAVLKVLEEIDYGVMLVTRHGELRLANPAGLAHCGAQGTMLLERGIVQPRDPADRPDFLQALASAGAGRRSMLVLHADASIVPLATVPLTSAGSQVADGQVVILFGRDRSCEAVSLAFYASRHGLTSAETVVLGKLCQGLRPAQIAARSGVSVSTVRTQIKSIRMKTGAAGVNELLQTVSRLPPMLSSVNRVLWSGDVRFPALGH